MIRLGSLAGYPFEGPRLLAGWTPPSSPAAATAVVNSSVALATASSRLPACTTTVTP